MPVQAPGSADSIWPATAAPVTDAATVFAGAAGAAVTAAVAAEVEVSLPESFVAVTTTRTYERHRHIPRNGGSIRRCSGMSARAVVARPKASSNCHRPSGSVI
ncbi:MAG TPA: hypothetical protein VLB81_04085, partial [Gaiellales bacterium]|nr:hypothetical protein [Gaiellales bacterium]